ncbi:MAG: hypothetical protein LUG91_01060 [Ruminococcus sp.]|nr:hypothetical protein [Ruminococcus sp.]
MKIKKILALLMVVTAFSTVFTGCSDEEKEEKKSASDSSAEESYESEDDSSSDNDSSGSIFNNSSNESEDTLAEQLLNSESAYVGVWYGKFFLGTSYYPNGNAYESWQDEDEYWTDDVDLEFFNEISLLYFNNGEFEQYTPEDRTETIYNYKGNYDIGENDQLILEYQQYEMTKDDETIYYNLNDITYEYDESTDTYTFDNVDSRVDRIYYEKMLKANANKFLYVSTPLFHYSYGYSNYFGCCYYYNFGISSYSRCGDDSTSFASCYLLDNYIVTQQYGFSFKGDVSRSSFTLENDVDLYDGDNTQPHLIIYFYDDGTWYSINADTGEDYTNGVWELYDDNILNIYRKGYENYDRYFLYLDFENEEIYVPAFCRCDEFIEVKEKFESYYEDEF